MTLRTLPRALLLMGLAAGAQAFDLQGHRGARGLAPENTLAAFERALEIGVSTLETDLHLSADGVLVLHHDAALNADQTRDAQGEWIVAPTPRLKELTLAQLRRYDVGRLRPGSRSAAGFPSQRPHDGQRIPTLAAAFGLVKERGADDVRFNLEVKMHPGRPDDRPPWEAIVDALLAELKSSGMAGRVTVQGFDWRALQRVQQLAPELPTAYLSSQSPRFDTIADGAWTAGLRLADHGSVPRMVKAAGGTIWSPNFIDLSEELVHEAHALGLRVLPWTVNEGADMERLIAWGVDGLITDYPDRARAALRASGLPLPRGLKN
ncbi:glycerophosphodiester phosphodiesterase [uncultured Piscinibacter sp.]|uniref:glycerophosphodiester phosphodiesterase n=1 Tax=uncultured Piscinibacter sp. TaxID=1131835 RepID=UPI00260C7376|nr:glycerophosphodiester phosphodiesterase [uncultured Piscinibacter sp.]